MNKSQRMQIKAVICVAGIVLLFIAAGILMLYGGKREKEKRAPVVEVLHNTYICEAADGMLTVFDKESRVLPVQADCQGISETDWTGGALAGQIADLTITDGVVTNIFLKQEEKISGKVLSVIPDISVELEEYGTLPFAEDVAYYVLYGQLRRGSAQDIRIGYSFADFVMENGRICAVLLTRDETMEYIRVQIKSSDYAGNSHESVTLSCDTDFCVRYEPDGTETEEAHTAGESITFTKDSPYFEGRGNRVFVIPTALTGKISLLSVNRSQGTPSYRGTMELRLTEEGIIIINEVLLEEYLYAVVPSEMPSGYPLEALKAQAVCARTYAYSHMLNPGLPQIGAHVDDSTAFQVYNNIVEQNATTTAVKETAGQLLYVDGSLIDTFYYSTSCGFGTDERVWNPGAESKSGYLTAQSISRDVMEGGQSSYTAEGMQSEDVFAQFIRETQESDFEKAEPWYRWTYAVENMDEEKMLAVLQSRYSANPDRILTQEQGEFVSAPVEKLGTVKNIAVIKRNAGGVAEELLIEGTEATYKVVTELNIRYVLCDGMTQAKRNDGSIVDMKTLLPSAFFIITPVQKGENMIGYEICGGGFGHGAGMSQNGAKCMAEAGYTAQQILEFFYKGSSVQKVE